MAESVIWTCDGCGAELNTTLNIVHDWKAIEIRVDGFGGYPVTRDANGCWVHHLCVRCQTHFADVVNPRNWPRPAGDAR